MRRHILALTLLSASFAFAATPVATVTAGPDIQVNGKALQTAGAPNWPVVEGDELVTLNSPATLLFPDGTRLTLNANSRVILQTCDHCIAQVFRGSVDFAKSENSKFEMCALGNPVRPAPGTQGNVQIVNNDKVLIRIGGKETVASSGHCPCNLGAPWARTGMSTGKKAALIFIPAAAAATAAGVAVTNGSTKSTK